MSDRFPGFLYGGAPISSWEKRKSMSRIDMAMARGRFSPSVLSWQGGGMSQMGSGAGSGDSSLTNLIVNYLPQCMAEKDLYALFVTVGPIESCRVMKDFKTGYSYGFGFVNYVREEDASAAITALNGYSVQNKRLKVSYARPSGDDIKETNLYVTNLPRAVTEQQLDTIFGKYGRIVQKHILRDKANGMPRGVAFVRYDKREEAQEAISALNNVIPDGGTEPLSVKVAEEHGKQKAAYYAGWTAGFHHNRGDFPWGYSGCGMEPMCHVFSHLSPPLATPGHNSHPSTPRDAAFTPRAAQEAPCNRVLGPAAPLPRTGYPSYITGKGNPRAGRGRGFPWGGFAAFDERYKGSQRFRNIPSTYW